jgi:PPOX class probable F420-dependent enzyme
VNLPIPESHIDLVTRPIHGVLTTLMPDGQPQSSLVWCDYDGEYICVNTTQERQKGWNMLRNSKISLLIVDPENTGRYLGLRGDVEIITDNVIEQLDRVTRKYTCHPQFYGYVYPPEQRERETRIIGRLHVRKITLDAIHK